MKRIAIFAMGLSLVMQVQAQFSRYVIRFKHKADNPFQLANPSAYLSQRAIDRRAKYNIAYDSTDLPVTPKYIDSIRSVPNVTVLNISKWLNSVSVQTTDANAISKINGFSFVQTVTPTAARRLSVTDKEEIIDVWSWSKSTNITANFFNYGTNSFNEIHLHNGEFLHNAGLRGQGIIISMLDAGYFNYNTLDAMDSIIANGQVSGTWDFVARETSVSEDNAHGMQCLSAIAANIPGQFIGTAPKANFYLYRTEDVASEYPVEEYNWVCGAERADSTGSDIISSSLGYTTFDNSTFNHTYADLNGNTTIAAAGADLAAKKGMLVVVAAGNDGNKAWHYLSTPADGDSVLTVGAVNVAGTVGDFSSFGPSADGQVKPDVAAVGVSALIQTTGNTVGMGNGTSYACPKMAGLAACLWQAFPEFNNMKIVAALRKAGSIASSPNDRIGYGIPDMKLAFINLLTDFSTANATSSNCKTVLNWTSKDAASMKYEIERKANGNSNFSKIGEVPGQGSVLANHTYQFADSLINVQAGTISYRIRQIVDTASADFTATYIDTVVVNNTAGCITTGINNPAADEDRISLSPNPVYSQLTLTIETRNAIPALHLYIYDIKGRLVTQYKKSKTTGRASFILPVAALPAGKYIISVVDDTKPIRSSEFIKL